MSGDPGFVDWYLVRHAPVTGAEQGIYRTGDEAADLSDDTGFAAASRLLPQGAAWYVSPTRRTRQTAEALTALVKDCADLSADSRLREQDFGEWTGLSFEELWHQIKHLPPHNWSYLAAGTRPPGGEDYGAVWRRVHDFLASAEIGVGVGPKILVTHAGVIRAIIGQALGLTPDRALAIKIDTLSVSKLTARVAVSGSGSESLGGNWQLCYANVGGEADTLLGKDL